jgi:hypothetical protein
MPDEDLITAPPRTSDFLASLDRMVGLVGRGLLVRSESFLQRIAHWLPFR